MSQKKWGQLIEEDTAFDDGFDENLLSDMREQYQEGSKSNSIEVSSSTLEDERGQKDHLIQDTLEGFDAESHRPEEFLDFEEFSHSLEQDDARREIELDPSFQHQSSKAEMENQWENPPGSQPTPPVHWKKILFTTSVGACALLAATGIIMLIAAFSDRDQGPLTYVRQPIPFHFFSEEQRYFFLARQEGVTELLKLELSLTFEGKGARNFLEVQNIQLRDLIHRSLLEQEASGGSFSQWQSILENSLFKAIRKNMPESNLQKLSITHLERV